MLDSLAHRYGCLPSEVLARGDTLDIEVLVRAQAYLNERDQQKDGSKPVPNYTQAELQAIVDKVKKQNG